MTRKLTLLGCHFILRSQLKLVFGSMNNEKYQNDIILGDIKMQCEYIAFPCKECIFIPAKVPCPWTKSYALHSRGGCNSVDWLGNLPDLHLIKEARNNLKKKSGKLLINICNLLYCIPGESVMKLCDEMSSRVEVGYKVKGGSTMY